LPPRIPLRRRRRTKIVATLGPASSTPEVIERLYRTGADVFRLNFSHGSHEDHAARIGIIRALERKVGRPIGILADVQGPKLRVGRFQAGRVQLQTGQSFRLDMSATPGDVRRVQLPHPEIMEAARIGTTLLLDDGKLRLRVVHKRDDHLETEILVGGALSDRKGVNVPDVALNIPALTAKDRADLDFVLPLGIEYIGLSFVQRAEDVAETQSIADGRAWVMVKLEKPQAVENLDSILALTDAVMVARGDLGVEMPPEEVPLIQKRIVRAARDLGKPVVVATQMLESMISAPAPTRAEASDVATAVFDGADAVMLSAETAAGRYPLETVREMAAICSAVEAAQEFTLDADFTGQTFKRIDQSIAMGALFTAHHLGAKAIVALTDSGSTVLWMSRHLISVPIYALTPRVSTQRRMALYRNVRPLLMDSSTERDMALQEAEQYLKDRGIVQSGDVYAITCGEPMGAPGGTNMLKICRAT